MNASNDSTHTDSESDRRQRFRIDDIAILDVASVTLEQTESASAESFFTPSASFNLVRELRAIDQDNAGILRIIGEKNSDFAAYLSATNKKIDAIGNAVAENLLDEDQKLQSIDLSEGGIGFVHETKLDENAYYAMKIWFHSALIGISVFMRVVACNRAIDGGYHISASFYRMPDAETKTISRHIMTIQAEQQRSKLANIDS